MSFWTSEKLKERIAAEGLIAPYEPSQVVHCAYEMRVGSQAFVTSNPSDTVVVPADKKIVIPPGQFGLLITEEAISLPDDAIAFISIRAGIKFQGLVNVSGFHVDPGYKGKLKFSVFNAGRKDVILDQGQPIFMIWFSDLDRKTTDLYDGKQLNCDRITADDVMRIVGEVPSPGELKQQIEELRTEHEVKINSIEKEQRILLWVFGILIALLIGAFVKVLFDGNKEARAGPPMNTPVSPPETKEQK
jgi:dCTP deaminase